MRAIQATERGGYEALRLVDIPQPQRHAGHALVRVTSAGVTPLDRTVLAGLHPRAKKSPLVPGNEGAGVVMEDPSGRFSAGERVLFFAGPGGVTEDGTFAEIASVPSGNLAALPGEIPDEIAGGLTEAECQALVETIRGVRRRGMSLIWIEHVLHALNAVVERLLVLNFGKVIGIGEPQAIMASREVREIYLGIEI